MNKEFLKRLIVSRQREMARVELVRRNFRLDPQANYVFVGMRRAGKSYLMFQYVRQLVQDGLASYDDILYVNFEDERLQHPQVAELHDIVDAYRELYDRRPVVLLDEIQIIEGWEQFVRRLADEKYRVIVTGSNAKMLSREIYTTLGGRFMVKEVFPFSFAEYLNYHGLGLTRNWQYDEELKAKAENLFPDYFSYGGCAEVFSLREKREWLSSLYGKILLGDIALRNGVRNDRALRFLGRKLAESVMQPTSIARLKNLIDSAGSAVSRASVLDYLQYMRDAYLIFDIPNYSAAQSERETLKKRYYLDNGILSLFLTDPETRLLENLVATDLYRTYGGDLYYYNRNVEVDFYVPGQSMAVQVSYDISDAATTEREVGALSKLSSAFGVERLYIVTRSERRSIRRGNLLVEAVPVVDWLLRDKTRR